MPRLIRTTELKWYRLLHAYTSRPFTAQKCLHNVFLLLLYHAVSSLCHCVNLFACMVTARLRMLGRLSQQFIFKIWNIRYIQYKLISELDYRHFKPVPFWPIAFNPFNTNSVPLYFWKFISGFKQLWPPAFHTECSSYSCKQIWEEKSDLANHAFKKEIFTFFFWLVYKVINHLQTS